MMKRLRAALFPVALLICTSVTPALAAGWAMTFSDEFNQTTLDRSKWATRYIYKDEALDHVGREVERYRDNGNHVEADGKLNLIARKTNTGWESGMIRSRQTFYYGYFEARVLLPKGKGVWPAFWINSDYNNDGALHWPPEVDIFEYAVNGKDNPDTQFHSSGSVFPPKSKTLEYSYVDPDYNQRLRVFQASQPLNEQWHVFGLLWVPGQYSLFMDGKKIYTRSFKWVYNSGAPAGPAHILLNFAVGGAWAGRYGIDEDKFPQAFSIDYVRVCQFLEVGGGQGACPKTPYTPDLSQVRYSAAPDLKKPVVSDMSASLVPTAGGHSLHAALSIQDFSLINASHELAIGLCPTGQSECQPKILAYQPLTAAGGGSEKKPVSMDVTLPDGIAAGKYLVMLGLVTPPDGKDPHFVAPITCGDGAKQRYCVAGTISVGN